MTSHRLLCTICTLYALCKFGMLKLTLTQHCYNSHINDSASFCGFRQLGWTNFYYSIRLTTQGKP